MTTYTSADPVENKNENTFRYPMKMLNTFIHGSALANDQLSLTEVFIVMLLCTLDPENGHMNIKRYIVEHMTNSILLHWIATEMSKIAEMTLPLISCKPCNDSIPALAIKLVRF